MAKRKVSRPRKRKIKEEGVKSTNISEHSSLDGDDGAGIKVSETESGIDNVEIREPVHSDDGNTEAGTSSSQYYETVSSIKQEQKERNIVPMPIAVVRAEETDNAHDSNMSDKRVKECKTKTKGFKVKQSTSPEPDISLSIQHKSLRKRKAKSPLKEDESENETHKQDNRSHGASKWTNNEKKALLKALKKYPVDDYEAFSACVPRKTELQIKHYLRVMKNRYKAKKGKGRDIEAPIELWLKVAGDITKFEQDYSSELSQVMSIAGSLEPHDPPRHKCVGDPDWNNVYQFITGLLQNDVGGCQRLTAIESAVVLDLLQNLSDYLNTLDTAKQRELMQKKFEQMRSNYQSYVASNQVEALTHGLDKDPINEFIPPYVPNKKVQVKKEKTLETDEPSTSSSADAKKQAAAKKSTLFSINPFSIPVKYLRPNIAE